MPNTGDFNLNLLNYDTHPLTGCFVDNLLRDSFIPLITKSTRYSDTTATLIDNILSNKLSDNSVSGSFLTDVSDHLPKFYINQAFSHKEPPKTIVTHYREINDVTINKVNLGLVLVF
jgi:hypothetical protein